jgi:hypothetical protein
MFDDKDTDFCLSQLTSTRQVAVSQWAVLTAPKRPLVTRDAITNSAQVELPQRLLLLNTSRAWDLRRWGGHPA